MSIYQPISTHENIKGSMGQQYPYSIIWGKLWQFLIFMELNPFCYYHVIAQWHWIWVMRIWNWFKWTNITHKKISKALGDNGIHTLQDLKRYCCNSPFFC